MESTSEVLDLLMGRSKSDSTSVEESALAGSILHARQCWDTEVKKLVDVVASSGEGEKGREESGWSLLGEAVTGCSEETLSQHCAHWTQIFTCKMQTTTDPAVLQALCRGLTSLLTRAHDSPQAVRNFTSQHLPGILQCLQAFSGAAASLQAMVLPIVAQCLVHFTASCSHNAATLKKWAWSSLFSSHLPLSQESSRVVVLLCYHSSQQWNKMVETLIGQLERIVEQLHHQPSKGPTKSKSAIGTSSESSTGFDWLELPMAPSTDPERTACLIQQLSQLARTLCYSLLFPPRDPTTPPSIPIERILTVVASGLKQPIPGHTVKCLVLQATLPILHTTMWSILRTFIKACHTHLLPYSSPITSLIATAITSKDIHQFPELLKAVHQTLIVWITVARDCEQHFLSLVLRSLLTSLDHTPSLRLSSLQVLCVVVDSLGPLLKPPLSQSISQLPMEHLISCTPPEEASLLLQLLIGCVTSRNPNLSPPLGIVLQILSQVRDHHTDRKVVSDCMLAIAQCSLLTHPSLSTPTSLLSSSTLHLPPSSPPTSSTPHLPPPTSSSTLHLPPPTSSSTLQLPPPTSSSTLQLPPPTSSSTQHLPPPTSSSTLHLPPLSPPPKRISSASDQHTSIAPVQIQQIQPLSIPLEQPPPSAPIEQSPPIQAQPLSTVSTPKEQIQAVLTSSSPTEKRNTKRKRSDEFSDREVIKRKMPNMEVDGERRESSESETSESETSGTELFVADSSDGSDE